MRKLHTNAPLISLIFLPLALGGCGASGEDDGSATALDANAGYSAVDAEIIETDADGNPRYRLRAAFIEQDARTLAIDLRSIDMRVDDAESGSWQLRADRGVIPPDARQVALAGDVQLRTERAGSGALRIRTGELDYDFTTTRALAPGKVAIDLQGSVLEGQGLEADLTRRHVKLRSDIHGEFAR